MQSADVIVVGGGPAGSTCARRLVDAGAHVIVIDAAVFPRDKVCAGWITPAVMETVGLDIDSYRRRHVFQPIDRFRVGVVASDRVLVTRGDTMLSAAIRRCEFDTWLLNASGADVYQGEPVRSIRRERDLWSVNERWTSPMLVGAGGTGCPVARHLNGGPLVGQSLIVAREIEFALSETNRRACGIEPGTAEIYFCDDMLGYGWCMRKGDVLNVGIGRFGRRLPRDTVRAFSGWIHEARQLELPDIDRWRGHSYVSGAPGTLTRIADGVLTVGDAAGLASERSGEGIGPAVESAVLAARVISAAAGDVSQARLASYDAQVAERWHQEHRWSAWQQLVPRRAVSWIGASLLHRRAFVERVVVRRWFLHAQAA
jgi:flavin-dependent dehydrogenase